MSKRRIGSVLAGCLLAWAAAAQDFCEEGNRAFSRRAYLDAQAQLWKCVVAGAGSKEPAYLLLQTYRELKNYAAGFEELRPLLEAQPVSLDLLLIKAYLHFRTGEHRESVRLLGRAYRLDQRDWRVHQLFALNYVVLKIPDGALQEFQVALELNPRNAELHYQLARFYYSQNRVSDSILASQKALALLPGYADVYNNLGLCYEALPDETKAIESYEKAIELNRLLGRKDEWPYLNYAALLIKQGEFVRSLAFLQGGLEQNPDSARVYYLRGKVLRKLARLTEAKDSLARSIALDGSDSSVYYEMATVLRKMGDDAGAREMIAKFRLVSIRRDPP